MIDITKKQYVISVIKLNLPKMREVLLMDKVYLYVGKQLNIQYLNNAKGEQYVLLGNAFTTNKKNRSIAEEVLLYNGNDINELVKSWTGRWILITPDEIQMDACGLMCAFYTLGAQWCISSSLALMSTITQCTIKKTVSENGLTWQLLPNTLIDGVNALLCTQKIIIKNNNIYIIFNQWINDYRSLTTNEKVEIIAEILQNGIYNIEYCSKREVWIALTSGKDSRLVLASALKSGIKFKTFTAWHENISRSDKKVPIEISKRMGFEHLYIKAKKVNKEMENNYKRFSSDNSYGADLKFYARSQFNHIPSNAIIIRGAIFEAAQKYARSIASEDIVGFKKGIETYYSYSLKDKTQSRAFLNWLQYIEENPITFVDIRDRMYIEQRVGGWVAAIEQALDINDWTSIQIANCRELVSVLLSASEDERQNLSLSFESIKLLSPPLHSYKYNESHLCDKLRLIIKTLKSPTKLKSFLHRIIKRPFTKVI